MCSCNFAFFCKFPENREIDWIRPLLRIYRKIPINCRGESGSGRFLDFLLIFVGSPSANVTKIYKIDWIQPLLRIFSEQACACLSSPWRALCPYTHYVVLNVSLACLRKFVHVCTSVVCASSESLRRFSKFAHVCESLELSKFDFLCSGGMI